jgi:hypothetical protein
MDPLASFANLSGHLFSLYHLLSIHHLQSSGHLNPSQKKEFRLKDFFETAQTQKAIHFIFQNTGNKDWSGHPGW